MQKNAKACLFRSALYGTWASFRGLVMLCGRLKASSLLAVVVVGCTGGSDNGAGPATTLSPAVTSTPQGLPAGGPATFSDQSAVWNVSHTFGFSNDMNAMVREFAGGAASGDIDGDGDLDLIVLRGNLGPNLVYRNTGTSFVEDAAGAGLAYTKAPGENFRHSAPTLGDLDGDGDLDLLLGGLENDPTLVFLNDGAGRFVDATTGSGLGGMTSIHTISMALGDYDQDGDLDIAMAHWGTPRDPRFPGETETLWRNDSEPQSPKFTAVSEQNGISSGLLLDLPTGVLGPNYDYTFAPSFADVNGDGHLDLLSVSDFRGTRIFVGDANGQFVPTTFVPDDENGMGSAVGDYDNDGDPDWFVSSVNGNRLYQNLGAGAFRRAAESGVEPGGWGWGACFADFNLDGWLDIYQTNGWEAGKDPSASAYVNDRTRLWMNNGDGTFTDRAPTSNVADPDQGRGVICDDLDDDGDVDVVLLTAEPQRSAYVWINEIGDQNYLKIRLEGNAPNTAAVGARIFVTVNGAPMTRWVGINSNFTSHNSTDQIFGLGSVTKASVNVRWPDGAESIFPDVDGNQTLVIRHPSN